VESRGNTPRLYRNTLVFLAADKTRLQDLDEAARKFLAWESILAEREALNLDPQQVKQAETQKNAADGTVTARLPETYQWLLVPIQITPQSAVEWQTLRLSGQDALAVRASKKLKNDELFITSFAATRLRMELDRVPLWRGDHVAIKQLVDDFARYLYLPRLRDPSVLLRAIREGLILTTWSRDSFAFADCFDEGRQRYPGLRAGQIVQIVDELAPGFLVKPGVAIQQMKAETTAHPPVSIPPGGSRDGDESLQSQPGLTPGPEPSPPESRPKRFHGSVTLDAARVGRDAGRIAEEVISHLSAIIGAKVTVTLELEAEVPSGVPDHVVRTVTENSRVLKFTSHGFEKE